MSIIKENSLSLIDYNRECFSLVNELILDSENNNEVKNNSKKKLIKYKRNKNSKDSNKVLYSINSKDNNETNMNDNNFINTSKNNILSNSERKNIFTKNELLSFENKEYQDLNKDNILIIIF